MKEQNNFFGKLEYIYYSLLIIFSSAFCYRTLCFKELIFKTQFGNNGFSSFYTEATQSKILFWALVIGISVLGIMLTFKKRRCIFSIFTNAVLPLEIYTILATVRFRPKLFTISFCIIGGLVTAYFLLIALQKSKQKTKDALKRRLKFAIRGSIALTIILMLLLTGPLCINAAIGGGMVSAPQNIDVAVDPTNSEQWKLSNNLDTISKLKPETWPFLELQEKLLVLRVIINVELRYFGIQHEVFLTSDKLTGETLAFYSPNNHTIKIDIEFLENCTGEEALGVILHECHHVYAYECVSLLEDSDPKYQNLLLFYNTTLYSENYKNYTSGNEDIEGYYAQPLEIAANAYATSASKEYLEAIADINS